MSTRYNGYFFFLVSKYNGYLLKKEEVNAEFFL